MMKPITMDQIAGMNMHYQRYSFDSFLDSMVALGIENFEFRVGDRIAHIHLNDGRPDGHLTWGDGDQPLEEHIAALSNYNYSGYITLELGDPTYYVNSEVHLKRGLSTLRNVLPYRGCGK